jgi:hypothetical protein
VASLLAKEFRVPLAAFEVIYDDVEARRRRREAAGLSVLATIGEGQQRLLFRIAV